MRESTRIKRELVSRGFQVLRIMKGDYAGEYRVTVPMGSPRLPNELRRTDAWQFRQNGTVGKSETREWAIVRS